MTGTGEWRMIRDAREPRNTRAGGAAELDVLPREVVSAAEGWPAVEG
jgi:hypothetical protein